MNRNQLFSTVQSDVQVSRSKFDLSKRRFTTFNQGQLVPIYVNSDVLPGDTFDVGTSLLARSRTPLSPVMDNAKLDTYWFFCPNRLLWKHTKEFYGENNESAWAADTTYTIPALPISSCLGDIVDKYSDDMKCCLWDHMGLPIALHLSDVDPSDQIPISVLPFRAYHLIWNDWFRDENLQDPILVPDGDTPAISEYYANPNTYSDGDFPKLLQACRIHDYFSSALPAPQKGAAVQIPLLGDAPVITGNNHNVTVGVPLKYKYTNTGSGVSSGAIGVTGSSANAYSAAPSGTASGGIAPSNLYADLSAVDAVSVNALRLAIASQRILERYARSGSRFTEFLRAFFGVVTPEAVLQMPQYLGGQTVVINNNQVVQTSQSANNNPLGNTGAYSLTRGAQHSFTKSFDEPGVLMCLAVVRVEHTFEQRIDRMWTRQSFFDFYTPPLAHLGEQQIKNYEIFYDYTDFSDNDEVFGYKEAWTEYRFGINDVTGEMRPILGNPGMRPWQYTDTYNDTPVLGPTWIKEPSTNVGQTLATSTELADQFFGDFFFNISAVRPLPIRSTPGMMDHF